MKKTFICLSVILILLLSCSCAQKNNMTDNLYDFTFVFDDETYTLPESITAFTDNGWSFPDDFDSFDYTVKYGNLKSTYLSKGDNWFNIEIFNYEKEDNHSPYHSDVNMLSYRLRKPAGYCDNYHISC